MLVVPGGGPFADAVRAVDEQVGLDDATAHALALRAMDQLGVLLRPLLPGAELLADLVVPRSLGLLQVAPAFAGRPDVPESWSVTSDSLAVLAAGAIAADEAILLKSVDGVLAQWPSDGPALLAPDGRRVACSAGARRRTSCRRLPARGCSPHGCDRSGARARRDRYADHPGLRARPARSSATAAATSSVSSSAARSPPRHTAERTPTTSASTRCSSPRVN